MNYNVASYIFVKGTVMKKKLAYEQAEIEVIEFGQADIVTASPNEDMDNEAWTPLWWDQENDSWKTGW